MASPANTRPEIATISHAAGRRDSGAAGDLHDRRAVADAASGTTQPSARRCHQSRALHCRSDRRRRLPPRWQAGDAATALADVAASALSAHPATAPARSTPATTTAIRKVLSARMALADRAGIRNVGTTRAVTRRVRRVYERRFRRSCEDRHVSTHGRIESGVQRLVDQGMADRHLEHPAPPTRNAARLSWLRSCPALTPEPGRLRSPRGLGAGGECGARHRPPRTASAIRAGVQLHPVGADSAAACATSGSPASTNRLTRQPSALSAATCGRRRSPSRAKSKPWSEVSCASPSGTSVACAGRACAHSAWKPG